MVSRYPSFPPSDLQYQALLDELFFLQEQDRFRMLTTNAPMGVCLCTWDGAIQYSNPAYSKIVGYTKEELQGKKFKEFTYPEDVSWNVELYLDVVEGIRESASFQKRYIHKRGHTIWCKLFISRMYKDDPNNQTIIAFIEDVTAAKGIEMELAVTQETLLKQYDLLDKGEDATHTGSVIYDASTKKGKFSRGLEALLGYKLGEMSQDRYYEDLMARVHPDDKALVEGYISRIPIQKEKVSFDFRVLWPNGQVRWIRVWRDRYLGDHTVFTSLQDITDEKEAQARLMETQTELERFVYSVTHDLKAPLSHIKGYAKWLEEEANLAEAEREKLEVIIRSTTRIGSMIDDLLHHSRRGSMVPFQRAIHLDNLLKLSQELFTYETKSKNIQWHVNPLPEVVADPQMMRLVFDNLLSNAIKYSSCREEPQIWISYKESPKFHTISVRDNGIGFRTEDAEQLFKVFQRLENAIDFPGNGIGLANVQRIIQLHGGMIWASGELNQGATFTFTLPK